MKLLTPERIRLMGAWRHSGFNVNPSVRIGAEDAAGRENLARYDTIAQTVIYKTKMVAGANHNFGVFDPLDFLTAVTAHIPNRGEHLVRYYGWYSSVQRGRRRSQGRENVALKQLPSADDVPHAKAARASAEEVLVFDRTCNDQRLCYRRSGIEAAVEGVGGLPRA